MTGRRFHSERNYPKSRLVVPNFLCQICQIWQILFWFLNLWNMQLFEQSRKSPIWCVIIQNNTELSKYWFWSSTRACANLVDLENAAKSVFFNFEFLRVICKKWLSALASPRKKWLRQPRIDPDKCVVCSLLAISDLGFCPWSKISGFPEKSWGLRELNSKDEFCTFRQCFSARIDKNHQWRTEFSGGFIVESWYAFCTLSRFSFRTLPSLRREGRNTKAYYWI